MIYGQHFNIVHMPKTGGTWLRRVCEKLPEGYIDRIYPHHLGFSALTTEEAFKPTYIFVRNPWDWYVSIYGHKHGNIVHRRHEFAPPFEELDPFHQQEYRRFHGTFEDSLLFCEPPVQHGIHPDTRSVSTLFENYSVRLDGRELRVLRFEDGVRSGLSQILRETYGEVPPDVEDLIQTHVPENVSERQPYASYYTSRLRDLVGARDAALIERFGYSFA